MRIACLSLILLISLSLFTSYFALAEQPPEPDEPMPQLVNLQIDPIGPTTAEIEPTKQYTFYFKFYNGGFFSKNYYLFYAEFDVEVEGEGWQAFVSPTWTYFWPNETKIGRIVVTASARPSNYATIHLYGRIKDLPGRIFDYWHKANFTFQVKLAQYHSFDVEINKTFIKGRQEEIYSLPVKIKNQGNYEDRFYIRKIYAPPGWKVGFSQSPIIIPPDGEASVNLYFAIPHEGVYVQERTHFILVEVRAEGGGVAKAVAVIVSVEGFHLTLGQMVALLSSMPSLLILAFVGIVAYRHNNPVTYLPKPWKEEEEELAKLRGNARRKMLREMKDEWKSAKYYMKWKLREERKLEELRRKKRIKQRRLEEKIKNAWKEGWEPLYNKWQEEKEKIKTEYEKLRRHIERKLAEAKRKGVFIDISLPEIKYPPEPRKPAMPKIPEYRIDERRLTLIEPDEVEVERILIPLERNKLLVKREIRKIEEMSKNIIENLKKSFEAIERKIDAEIRKKSRK